MNDLTVPPAGYIAPTQGSGALMALIGRMATEPTFDVAKLEALLAVKERWEAGEAKKAYDTAFAAFKAEAVRVVKNRDITDGPLRGRRYADLFAVVDSLTPALSKHGLSASWSIVRDDKDWIVVECILTHVGGHAERRQMGGPPDAGGAKNAIQARASAVSYLERYTFLAVCGMAAADSDDDGRGGAEERPPGPDPWTPELEAAAKAAAEKGKQAFKAWWQERAVEWRELARPTQKYADYLAVATSK